MTMHSDIEDTKRLMGALVSEADLARGPAFPTLDCKCWGRLAEESSCQVGLLTWRRFEARAGSPNELLYSRLESAKFVLYPLSQILGRPPAAIMYSLAAMMNCLARLFADSIRERPFSCSLSFPDSIRIDISRQMLTHPKSS